MRVSRFLAFVVCFILPVAEAQMINSSVTSNQISGTKKTIHLLGLMPLTSTSMPVGHIILPAVDLALRQINAREDILPDYELQMHWRDTKCEPGTAVDDLYRLLFSPPMKTMIVGEMCSIACEPIARASVLWNMTHVSFGCKTPSLSDRSVFPNFFRCTPSEAATIPVFVQLLRYHNWKNVALIHEAQEYWSMYSEKLHNALDAANVSMISSEIFLGDPSLQVHNLQKHGVRIVFGGFYQDSAVRVLCEAYKIGFYGPKIVWLFVSWYLEDYWYASALKTDCTPEQVLKVVRTSVLYAGVDDSNPSSFHTPTVGNMSRAEAYAYIRSLLGPNTSAVSFMAYPYNGMWATALALNRTVQKMKEIGFPRGIDEYKYGDNEMTALISASMEGLEFQGVYGPLSWEHANSPRADMSILQQWDRERVMAGWYKVGADSIEWNERGIIWERGRPPRDSEVTIFKVVKVKNSLFTFMCCMASLGIVFSIVLLGFNVHFRQKRVIKMSSPNINNVMLIGCLISYTTVFFTPTKDEVVSAEGACIATLTTLLVGFSLMFGALFSKTWRIHVIMRSSKKMNKKVIIKDSKLIGILLGLVMVDVFIVVIWQAIDRFTVVVNDGTPVESSEDPDVWIVPQTTGCQSKYETYFSGVLYGIQGLMLAFGAFLAWETRQVKLAALNDSKEIGMCIYNVLILGVMGVLINLVVDDVDVKYGFTSSTIIAATALVQCLIFIPKIFSVHRGDEGGLGPSKIGTSTYTNNESTLSTVGNTDHMGNGDGAK